jgi:hypothetical protein
MKKIIIALSCLLLAAVVVVKVANAQVSQQDVKKAASETKMTCCKSSTGCSKMSDMASCGMKSSDAAKCKEAKCDTSKCKTAGAEMKCAMKNCDPAKCSGMTKK